jgi:hypothetical protein
VADLVGGTAFLHPLLNDNAIATVANAGAEGRQTQLALTDPDSSEIVPGQAPRFQGDYVLDSQGDRQQIYLHDLGAGGAPTFGRSTSRSRSTTPPGRPTGAGRST